MSSDPIPSSDPKPSLSRLPLKRVWFVDEIDLPGGHAITQSIQCGKAPVKGRQYFLGWFVPSFQVVDIEWYRTEDAEPERRRVPMSSIQQMGY